MDPARLEANHVWPYILREEKPWHRRSMVRRIWLVISTLALALVGPGMALAWNCPVQIKSAEDAIKRAEAMSLTPEAKHLIEEAKKMVAEAKKNHIEATAKIDHANAMWKAKAAQAQAEAAIAVSMP